MKFRLPIKQGMQHDGGGSSSSEPLLMIGETDESSDWWTNNSIAQVLLMHTNEIKYMCMVGYTFMNGVKLYKTLPQDTSISFRFVSLFLQCTGGGILVPLFLNRIPYPISQDAYPVAVMCSFLLHEYIPWIRDIYTLSIELKLVIIMLYEILRAYVVCKLTIIAGDVIEPSEFTYPVFGPIICGTIAGCGGLFLPLNKGLDPIKKEFGQPMLSAFIASTCLHLFINTPSLSYGITNVKKKGQLFVIVFFVVYNILYTFKPWKTCMKQTTTTTAAAVVETKPVSTTGDKKGQDTKKTK